MYFVNVTAEESDFDRVPKPDGDRYYRHPYIGSAVSHQTQEGFPYQGAAVVVVVNRHGDILGIA